MFEIFKSLIKLEGPDYILDNKSVSYGQLHAVTCMYAKDKKFYTAVTFYTDVWISKHPLGPMYSDSPTAEQLRDVATIRVYDSMQACRAFPVIGQQDLKEIVNSMNHDIDLYLDSIVKSEVGDFLNYKLVLSPVPCVVVSIVSTKGLVGTAAMFTDGHVLPVMECMPRMQRYISKLRERTQEGRLAFGSTLLSPMQEAELNVHQICLGGD